MDRIRPCPPASQRGELRQLSGMAPARRPSPVPLNVERSRTAGGPPPAAASLGGEPPDLTHRRPRPARAGPRGPAAPTSQAGPLTVLTPLVLSAPRAFAGTTRFGECGHAQTKAAEAAWAAVRPPPH